MTTLTKDNNCKWLSDDLAWAPEISSAVGGEASSVSVESISDMNYGVVHYGSDATGRAFGPLSLAQTLRFCCALEGRLKELGRICLTTPPGDKDTRANAAVLVGAYLVLNRQWAVEQIRTAFGSYDANLKFTCSWSRKDQLESTRLMSVEDCWTAFEEARSREWLSPDCVRLQDKMESVCTAMKHSNTVYDASWLIPGSILVAADPVTTAIDPNPATFKHLVPEDSGQAKQDHNNTCPECSCSPCLCMVDPTSPHSCTSVTSVETVNKQYGCYNLQSAAEFQLGEPMDFASFLKSCGVNLLVRANLLHEPGLKESYDPAKFVHTGIEHVDIPVDDIRGGLPSQAAIKRMISACAPVLNTGNAIAVHCKGGFGRSVVLACCVAAVEFGIPGNTLLAWARLARPGAITNPQQEKFTMGLPRSASQTEKPLPCCHVQ